jgi:hypothetical protein
MKLPGWEKAASAEQYREMIEAEYYRLKEERSAVSGSGVGLEEVKLRLFLSLIEKPSCNGTSARGGYGNGVVREFPAVTSSMPSLLNDDQAPSDQVA